MAEKSFAESMFDYRAAESEFTDALCEAGFGEFSTIGGDDYDNSIEIYQVGNDERMSPEAQRVIFDARFSKAYVNHKDGWETHYSWDISKPFSPSRGWRRRYVKDPSVITTRQCGADDPAHRGYYEISYWPESWTSESTRGWLSSGYMRIVPDPLDRSLTPPNHPDTSAGQDSGGER